jgi:hypothetical protein
VFICFWIKSAGTTAGFLTGCIVHTEGLTSVILRGLLCNREARISSFPSVPRVSTCTYFDLCAHAVYTVYEYFCFFDFCLMHGSVHLKAGARSTLQVYSEQSSMSTGSYPICPPMMYICILCLTPCPVNHLDFKISCSHCYVIDFMGNNCSYKFKVFLKTKVHNSILILTY